MRYTNIMMRALPRPTVFSNLQTLRSQRAAGLFVCWAAFLGSNTTLAQSTGVLESSGDFQKHQRYQLALQQKKDSLKFTLKGRIVAGIRYGQFVVPSYIRESEPDPLTGTDIASKRSQWTIYANYFVSSRWAIGLDAGLHKTAQTSTIKMTNYGHIDIKGSGGANYNVLLTAKYLWGRGGTPTTEVNRTVTTSFDSHMIGLNVSNSARMRRPRFYTDMGIGFTSTMLIKVKGNPGTLSKSSYKQTVPTGFVGAGVFSRLGTGIVFDLGCRYMASKAYEPAIGQIKSYTGFDIQMALGLILNSGFPKVRKQLSNSTAY